MKQLRSFTLLLFSAVLLAACNQDIQPPVASTAPSFSFAIDPASGSAKLENVDTQALEALQTDTCEAGVRTLTPGRELALVDYDYAFLPGNILEITASFQNVTTSTYEQPFSFYQDSKATSNIVSSTEPTVSDDDLGGDGALSPLEPTSQLTFTVEHMGQPFTYGVFAEADVNCPAPSPNATLTLSKTDGDVTAEPGDTIVYTLSYANTSGFASNPATLYEGLPQNTTFNAEESTAGWSCEPFEIENQPIGTICTLELGVLQPSATGSATFAVTVDDPLGENVTQIDNGAAIADQPTENAAFGDFDALAFDYTPILPRDNENPAVTFDDPGDLNTGCAVALEGTATDNVAVSSVEIYEGDTKLGDATLSGNDWSYSYTPSAPGTYTFRAVATDAESNSGSAEQNVSVTAPTVVNGNDSGTGSLRQAVADAQAGDTITFACDVETVTLTSGQITLDKNLTIDGNVTIDGNANSRIFTVNSGTTVVLNDLTMTNGRAFGGGGVANEGNLTLSGTASISDNYSPGNDGGAYNTASGIITLKDNASISNNTAAGLTGGIYNGGILNLQDNASITGNTSLSQDSETAGGVFTDGLLTLSGSAHISGNTAVNGGGVYIRGRGDISGASYDPNDTGSGTSNNGQYNIYGNTPNQVAPQPPV